MKQLEPSFLVAINGDDAVLERVRTRFGGSRVRALAEVPTYLVQGDDALATFRRVVGESTDECSLAVEPVGQLGSREQLYFNARRLGHVVRVAPRGQYLFVRNPSSPQDVPVEFPFVARVRLSGWDSEVEMGTASPWQVGEIRSPARVSALPVSEFPLVGRYAEASRLLEFLLHSGAWLTTVTGPAGVGKTRLVTAVVHEQEADGANVHLVDLSLAGSQQEILEAIAGALGLQVPASRPAETLLSSEGPGVLFLDDPLDSAQLVGLLDLWRRLYSHLRFVVTSAMPLALPGERRIQLGPLSIPRTDGTPSESEILFNSVARHSAGILDASLPDAELVAGLCSAMQGLPLPIVVVASQVGTQPLRPILDALERGGGSLVNSGVLDICLTEAPESLRPAIQALASCHGSLSRSGALHVLAAVGRELGFEADSVLTELLRRGLVSAEIQTGRLRVSIAFRQADEEIDAITLGALSGFLSKLCSEVLNRFPRAPAESIRALREERALLLQVLASLADVDLAADRFEPVGRALLLLNRFFPFPLSRKLDDALSSQGSNLDLRLLLEGLQVEALRLESHQSRAASSARSLLEKESVSTGAAGPLVRFRALKGAGAEAGSRGDIEEALRCLDEAAEVAKRSMPTEYLEAKEAKSVAQRRSGLLEDAEETALEALAYADAQGIVAARPALMGALANVEFDRGELDAAAETLRDAASLAEEVGDARAALANRVNCAIALHEAGRARESLDIMELVLPTLDRNPPMYQCKTWLHYGTSLVSFARFGEALEAFQTASRIARLLGDRTLSAEISIDIARCHLASGNFRPAEVEIRRAERALGQDRVDMAGWRLRDTTARLSIFRGRFEEASALCLESERAVSELGNMARAAEFASLEALAHAASRNVATAQEALERAERSFQLSGLMKETQPMVLARGWVSLLVLRGQERAMEELERVAGSFEERGDGESTDFLLNSVVLTVLHGHIGNESSSAFYKELVQSVIRRRVSERGVQAVPDWIESWLPVTTEAPKAAEASEASAKAVPERPRGSALFVSATQTLDASNASPVSWLEDDFEILGALGAGQFGSVYHARDRALDREVAIKCFHSVGGGSEPIALHLEEGRLLARVDHTNVVRIFGLRRNGSDVVLIMELLRGDTLDERVKKQKQALTFARRLFIQMCKAIGAIHDLGLIHRDIKPQNIMLVPSGAEERAVLMDLGLGLEVSSEHSDKARTAGSPAYMAPELFSGFPPTRSSDMYSLGVVMFQTLAGGLPVHAESISELVTKHRRRQRASLADLRPDLPIETYETVDWCLAADPRNRVASPAELEGLITRWPKETVVRS